MDNGLIFPYRRRTAHTELWMLTMMDYGCCGLRAAGCVMWWEPMQ